MSAIVAIAMVAVLFGVFTWLRARDRGGCTGGCVGCTGHGRCETGDEGTTEGTHGAKS